MTKEGIKVTCPHCKNEIEISEIIEKINNEQRLKEEKECIEKTKADISCRIEKCKTEIKKNLESIEKLQKSEQNYHSSKSYEKLEKTLKETKISCEETKTKLEELIEAQKTSESAENEFSILIYEDKLSKFYKDIALINKKMKDEITSFQNATEREKEYLASLNLYLVNEINMLEKQLKDVKNFEQKVAQS